MMELSPTKQFDCAAQAFEHYDRSGIVLLGTASCELFVHYGKSNQRRDTYTVRTYIDYGQSKCLEGEPDVSPYDWYILTVQRDGGVYGFHEVVIGEGPSLEALLSPAYIGHFGFEKLSWRGWDAGLLGQSFAKWLKKNKFEIDED